MAQPGGIAADQLRAFIERIERLEEEKKTISDDIKDVYAEAKANGYDTKVMRQVVRIRKQDKAEAEATCRAVAATYARLGYELVELPFAGVEARAEFVMERVAEEGEKCISGAHPR